MRFLRCSFGNCVVYFISLRAASQLISKVRFSKRITQQPHKATAAAHQTQQFRVVMYEFSVTHGHCRTPNTGNWTLIARRNRGELSRWRPPCDTRVSPSSAVQRGVAVADKVLPSVPTYHSLKEGSQTPLLSERLANCTPRRLTFMPGISVTGLLSGDLSYQLIESRHCIARPKTNVTQAQQCEAPQ